MGEQLTFSSISALEIHPNGDFLAVGYDNGSIAVLKILQASSLTNNNNSNSQPQHQQPQQTKRNKLIGNKRKTIDENEDDDNQFKMDLDEEDNIRSSDGSNNSSSGNSNMGSSSDDIIRTSNDDNNDNSSNYNDIIKINIDDNKSYKVLCYYQAHDTEVIQIKWCKNHSSALLFLSTSVSSIKLWRLQLLQNQSIIEKPSLLSILKNKNSTASTTTNTNNCSGNNNINNNNIYNQFRIKFDLKRSFEHEEIFNINSISLNSDGNTFLSSDELRVYLWDLNQNQECYNIIDLKPTSMQLLNEVIRVTKFHPNQCNLLMYGTSRGSLKLCDMRDSALINSHSRCYEPLEVNQSTFADYLNSILDMSFSLDGRYIVSRNLQSLSIWDMNMDNRPLAIYNLYNQNLLNQKLYDFHESSAFVNKFQCNFINQNQVITGSYDNKCLIWNPFNSESFILESNLKQQDPKDIAILRSRIDSYFEQQQQQQTNSLSRDQVMSFFNKLYYQSNFYNIQLSTLSKIYNISNINNSNNGSSSFNNNGIFNNNNISDSINNASSGSKLTINDYSNRIGSISTAYNSNNTLSLVLSSSDHLFLYK